MSNEVAMEMRAQAINGLGIDPIQLDEFLAISKADPYPNMILAAAFEAPGFQLYRMDEFMRLFDVGITDFATLQGGNVIRVQANPQPFKREGQNDES
jgi:hypothetical protein